ncbi:MAG TPA: type III-A CRISPR-associated RAMP protein Csm5, partial [Cytophagaceae bacterium]
MKRYVKLTVLSPVYIGDDKGQRSPLEYYLEQGAYVHVISEDKLIRALKECNKLNDFMSYLERETSPNMNRFFQQLAGQQNFVLRKATERKIKTKVSHLSNLRLHMVDPVTAEPYIPATSIKGSLRLALLYCLASRNVEAFRNKVKDAMEDRRNQREPGRNLDAYYFQRYDIAPNSRSNIGTRNDLLRMLKISDAFVDPHSRVDYVSEVV